MKKLSLLLIMFFAANALAFTNDQFAHLCQIIAKHDNPIAQQNIYGTCVSTATQAKVGLLTAREICLDWNDSATYQQRLECAKAAAQFTKDVKFIDEINQYAAIYTETEADRYKVKKHISSAFTLKFHEVYQLQKGN